MTETRIKISSVVEGQLPSFVREEFPLVSEFLSQYYLSLEYQSGATDLLQNIDQLRVILENIRITLNLSRNQNIFNNLR